MGAAVSDYLNNGQQRLISVIGHLAGHEYQGISVGALADKTGAGGTAVFRDVQNLKAAGWAEQLPGGTWRLTPEFAGMMRRVQRNIMMMMEQVNRLNIDYIQGEG